LEMDNFVVCLIVFGLVQWHNHNLFLKKFGGVERRVGEKIKN